MVLKLVLWEEWTRVLNIRPLYELKSDYETCKTRKDVAGHKCALFIMSKKQIL